MRNQLNVGLKQNIYLIKSIKDQKLIGLSKTGIQLEFNNIDINCEKQFNWIIQSEDQEEQQYEFRFGEFVFIQNLQRNLPIHKDKVPFLLQFYNEAIDSQVFNKSSNNLIGNQPCILKNNFNNRYLSIQNNELTYSEQPFYFQIIPKQIERIMMIERPFCNLMKEFQIRNYLTGQQLSITSQFETEKCLTIKSQKINPQEKWKFIKIKENVYHIYNQALNSFIQNLSIEKQQESKQIFVCSNKPRNSWKIICPQAKQLSYGIPFLIQDIYSGYYANIDLFNPKDNESNEYDVILSKNIETTSLWVVYNIQ